MSFKAQYLLPFLGLLVIHQATAQVGLCPTFYHTSPNFTQSYIDNMSEKDTSYLLVMSNAGSERCQVLKFTTPTRYNFSFVTTGNESTHASNTFTASPWNLNTPAEVRLVVVPGLLDAFPLLRQTMFPVIARDDLLVFITCSNSFPLTATKKVLAFVPFPYSGSPTMDEIRDTLNASTILYDGMKEIDQDCSPPVRSASASQSSGGFFNFLSGALNLGSLFQGEQAASSAALFSTPQAQPTNNDLAQLTQPAAQTIASPEAEAVVRISEEAVEKAEDQTAEESESVASESESAASETEPAASESESSASESEPAASELKPHAAESVPVPEESKPAVEKSTADAEKPGDSASKDTESEDTASEPVTEATETHPDSKLLNLISPVKPSK